MKFEWCGHGHLREFGIKEMVHCHPERPIYCDTQKKQFYQQLVNEIMKQPIKLHWRLIKNNQEQYSFAEVKTKVNGDIKFNYGELCFIQPISVHFIYLIFKNELAIDQECYPYIRVIYYFHEN